MFFVVGFAPAVGPLNPCRCACKTPLYKPWECFGIGCWNQNYFSMMKINVIDKNYVNLFFQQKLKTVRMNTKNVNRSSNIQGVKSGTFSILCMCCFEIWS